MKQSIIFAFLIILLGIPCNGQNQLDSLRNVYQNETISNEDRANALWEYSKNFDYKNNDSLLFYGNKLYAFAEETELDYYMNISQQIIGNTQRRKGEFIEAEKAYKKAIEITLKNGDSASLGTNLSNIGLIYSNKGDYNTALDYYNQGIALLENHGKNLNTANVMNNRAIIYIRKGDYEQAALDLETSIQLYKNSENPAERTGPMVNLALLKTRQGDFAGAIELYTESLAINEQQGNEFNMAYTYLNIANLHYKQGDHSKFFEYAFKSLEIRERLRNKPGIVRCLSNIGSVYFEDKEHDKALQYLERALPMAEELNLKNYLNHTLLIIGEIQIDQGKFELANININRALKIANELEDKVVIAKSFSALGLYYKAIGDYKKATYNLNKGLALAKENEIELTKTISKLLYETYTIQGKNSLALKNYELYIAARDSINSVKNKEEIIRQEFKYSYDKKALQDSISFAREKELQQATLEKTKNQRHTLLIILGIVLVFSILLFNRIRLVKKQKNTIETQNIELNNLNENLEKEVANRTQEIVEINHNLRESDERYTYALEASNEGIWDYNVLNNSITFSPAIYTMLGYKPYEFPESREALYNLLHSDDKKIEKHNAHNLFITQNNSEFLHDEYRFIGKEGNIVWVQVKGKIVERNTKNKPLRIVGTHTDITASKQRSQEKLETILRTEDAERSRIAKEIHDGLQQTLTVSFMNFDSLKKELPNTSQSFKKKFNLGWQYLSKSINESRNVAHSLMPQSIVDNGVLAAFQNLIEDTNNSSETTEYLFYHNLKSERLPNQQIEITLYRILQEALNNIYKYASATTVHIQLKDFDDIYMLLIEDNGVGFNTEILQQKGKGLGFQSMKNRLDAISGHIEIDSVKGKGTSILVEIDK